MKQPTKHAYETDDDAVEFEIKKPRQRLGRAYLPLMGFILVVALGAIAWVAGPLVVTWLDQSNVIAGFPPAGVPRSQTDLLLTIIIFGVMMLIAGLILAAAMPKKRKGEYGVTEKSITKERDQMVLDKKRKKKLQQDINRRMKGQP